jgi:exonuclease SbcC
MMRINELSVKGFLCFTEKKLRFDNHTLIFGNNGSGKSAILDAILFALYGKITREINIINNASTSAQVVLNFTLTNDTYNITRTLDNHGMNVIILKNDKEVSEKEIINALGSFEEFVTKSVIKQDYLNILDYNLIDAYKSIFNINYDNYRNTIRNIINEKEGTLDNINKEINSLQIFNKIINNINDYIKQLEDKKNSYIQILNDNREALARLEESRANVPNIKAIEEMKKRLLMLEDQLNHKNLLLKELDINSEEYESIKKDYDEFIKIDSNLRILEDKIVRYHVARNIVELLEPIIEENNKDLVKLSQDLERFKAMYRSSSIDIKALRDELLKLENSKVELEKQRNTLNLEIEILNNKLNDLSNELEIIKHEKICKRCKQEIVNNKDIIGNIKVELENLTNIIKDKREKLANIMSNLRKLNIKIEQQELAIVNANIIEKIEVLNNKLTNILQILNAKLSDSKGIISSLKLNEKDYELTKKKYESLLQNGIIKYLEYRYKIDTFEKINKEISNIKNEISLLNKELERFNAYEYSNLEDNIANKVREKRDLEHEIDTINKLIEERKQLIDLINKSLKIEELEQSARHINNELTALKELENTLDESLLEYISNILISIKPYIDQLSANFKLNIVCEDNDIIVNDVSISNLSRGMKALIYIILKLGYMHANGSKIIIIDDNLMLDKDKTSILVSNIKMPLVFLTTQDLRTAFRHVIEL